MGFLLSYFKSSYAELKKVVWPDREEVIKVGMAIIAFVIILSLLMWLYDSFFGWFVYKIILMWR